MKFLFVYQSWTFIIINFIYHPIYRAALLLTSSSHLKIGPILGMHSVIENVVVFLLKGALSRYFEFEFEFELFLSLSFEYFESDLR